MGISDVVGEDVVVGGAGGVDEVTGGAAELVSTVEVEDMVVGGSVVEGIFSVEDGGVVIGNEDSGVVVVGVEGAGVSVTEVSVSGGGVVGSVVDNVSVGGGAVVVGGSSVVCSSVEVGSTVGENSDDEFMNCYAFRGERV